MNKRFIPLIIGIFAMIIVFISLSMAWYTRVNRIPGIDASTDEVTFSYEINDIEGTINEQLSITNLAFFDIDDEEELVYFKNMACLVKLSITNTSKMPIVVNITQNDPNKDENTTAYSQAIFLNTVLDISSYASIEDIVNESSTYEVELTSGEGETDSILIYMYLFGVQTNDGAYNSEFLDNKYYLDISIEAKEKD